jgi:hypothetical protein
MMEKYGYDPDLYFIPDSGYDEETGESYFEYQGERYFNRSELDVFSFGDAGYDELVDLAWHYNFPFSGTVIYSATTIESPDFIVVRSTCCFFYAKESFNLQKQVFVVEDTGVEIEFSQMYVSNSDPRDNSAISDNIIAEFVLYSKKYAPIQIEARVLLEEGVYYLDLPNYPDHQISDDFMHLLIETGVISNDYIEGGSD